VPRPAVHVTMARLPNANNQHGSSKGPRSGAARHHISSASRAASSFVSRSSYLQPPRPPPPARACECVPIAAGTKPSLLAFLTRPRPPQARNLEKEPQQADDNIVGPPLRARNVDGRHLQRVAARLAVRRRRPAHSNVPGALASPSFALSLSLFLPFSLSCSARVLL
jgi:hypothetical protein